MVIVCKYQDDLPYWQIIISEERLIGEIALHPELRKWRTLVLVACKEGGRTVLKNKPSYIDQFKPNLQPMNDKK